MRMLGREAVADRHDDRATAVGDLARDRVVVVDAADGPATAVEEDHDREDRVGDRAVDAHRNRTGGPRDLQVAHVGHRLGRSRSHRDEQSEAGANLGKVLVARFDGASGGDQVEHRAGLRMQRHL